MLHGMLCCSPLLEHGSFKDANKDNNTECLKTGQNSLERKAIQVAA